jgi:LEA14-like dessication related protein
MNARQMRALYVCFAAWLIGSLAGCASLTADIDPPKVSMESFRALPSEGGVPRFEIKLRVTNPNKQSLDIAGISYSIELFDKEVMNGVANDVPLIEPYTQETVTLEAGLQMFQLLRLLASLGTSTTPADAIEYSFSAKIDFNGLVPTQRIKETGEIRLQ